MTGPHFIVEHRIVFVDSGLRARVDALEAAVAQLIGKVNHMADVQETMDAEIGEFEAKAQANADATTALSEVVSDLRATIAEMQQNQGNVVSAEKLAEWKSRTDAAQAKMDETNAKLVAALSPPAPAPAPAP